MIQTLLPFRYISAFLFILLFAAMTGGDMYAQAVRFAEPADTVGEGSDTVTLEVILLEESSDSWDVVFQSNLSSASPEDFLGTPGSTISFPPGSPAGSRQQITLRLNNDAVFEREKHATFLLKSTEEGAPAVSVFRLVLEDDDRPGVIITELLADPGGDANGDGREGEESDRFIELYNREASAVELAGWTLTAGDGQIVHLFSESERIPSGGAMVLFGGERWNGSFGGSRVVGVSPLRLNPGGGQLTLSDAAGTTIDRIAYGPAGPRTGSWVREADGETVRAHTASSDGSLWSPGRQTDGSWYSRDYTLQGEEGWRVISVPGEHLPVSDLLPEDLLRGGVDSDRSRTVAYFTGYDGGAFTAPDNPDETLTPGTGMMVYYPGDGAAGDFPVTLDSGEAEPPAGNVVVPLHVEGDRWNLLGNPWPEAIDLGDIATRTRGGELESGVVQVWDGQARSFVPLSVSNGRVEPWQGFFVRNGSATGLELPHPEDTDRSPVLEEEAGRKIAFTLTGGTDGELADRAAVVTFGAGSDHQWDSGDGEKLTPLSDAFVTLGIQGTKEGEPVMKAQDSRPLDLTGELNIRLAVDSRNYEGPMHLQWDMDRLPEEWEVTLHDRVTGETVDLKTDESYSFDHRAVPRERNIDTRPRLETVSHDENETPRFRLRVTGRTPPPAEKVLPESVKLNPNYPNPFSTSTTISFELSENTHVTLSVWNMLGQKVATLIDEVVEAGEHERVWNAGNLPSTIYIIHLEVNGVVYNRKMALIK